MNPALLSPPPPAAISTDTKNTKRLVEKFAYFPLCAPSSRRGGGYADKFSSKHPVLPPKSAKDAVDFQKSGCPSKNPAAKRRFHPHHALHEPNSISPV